MSIINSRQVPDGMPPEVIESAFNALTNNLTEAWLLKSNSHPLRELWKRRDILATNELISLGNAIAELSANHPLWFRAQLKAMKAAEKNNHAGAFAEIMGIYMLNNKGHETVPATNNQPGYDAIMSVADTTKKIRFSIKNYGMSTHENQFTKCAIKTEELIQKLLKKHKYYPATVWIDCPAVYPEKDKWDMLHNRLDEILRSQKGVPEPFTALATDIPEWVIIVSPNIATEEPLHPNYQSYTFLISGVYHRNENDNLLSKLNGACDNLIKHSAYEGEDVKNFLLIHLSPLASIVRCKEWLDDYFRQFPDKPISAVLFHQPSVATDLSNGTSFLHHYFFPYVREDRMVGWLPENFHFNLKIDIGISTGEPVKTILNFDYPGGSTEQISVDNRYMYQRGQHYVKMQPDANGAMWANITSPVPGVFSNAVIEMPNDPNQAVIAGIFPPSDLLLIL